MLILKNIENKVNISNKNKGVSLIVLIVTIIIMIIIASTIFLIYKDNLTRQDAKIAVLRNDIDVMSDQFTLVYGKALKDAKGDKTKVQESDLASVIPEEYKDRFKATTEGIVYLGDDEKIIALAKELNFKTSADVTVPLDSNFEVSAKTDRININILNPNKNIGIKYKYKLIEYNTSIENEETVNLTNYTKSGLKNNTMYNIEVSEVSSSGEEKLLTGQNSITTENIKIASFSGFSDEYTKGPINLIINYPSQDGIKNEWSYDLNSTNWNKTLNTQENIKVTQNLKIYARRVDESGNKSDVKTLIIDKIDTLSPKLFIPKITTDSYTIKVSGVTVDAPSTLTSASSGIAKYGFSIDGGASYELSDNLTNYTFNNLQKDTEYNVKMKAIDKAGNEIITDELKTKTQNLEKPAIDLSKYDWINQDITAKITYVEMPDTTKQYSYDGVNWSTYATPLVINNNKTIYARLINSFGQESNHSTLEVTKIDKIIPNTFIPTAIEGVDTLTVNGNTTDASKTSEYGLSGIKYYQFSIDNGNSWTEKQEATGYFFKNLTRNTQYNVKMKAIDVAGNETISQTLVAKTNDAWVASEHISFNLNPNTWTNQNVTLDVVWSADVQGFEKKISYDGMNWTNYTGTITVEKNNTLLYAKFITTQGEESAIASVKVENIDKLAPASIDLTPNNAVNIKQANVNILAKDTIPPNNDNGFSDIGEVKYIWNNSSTVLADDAIEWNAASTVINGSNVQKNAVTGDHYLHVRAKDNAGNIKTVVSGKYEIDNTAPIAGTMTMKLGSAAGVNYINNTWTNQSVYLAPVDGTDAYSGHSSTTYTVSGANTVTSTSVPTTITNTGTSIVNVLTIDNAGNTSTRSYTVKIDKALPIAGTMIMKLGNASGANYTDNTWTNQNVYLEPVNGSDTDSGHSSTTYTVSGANTVASTSTSSTIVNEGTSTVTITTTDNTGNISTRTYTVKIDKVIPVAGTMIMKLGSAAGSNYIDNTWTNQSIYLEPVNGTDALSGHSSTTYVVSGANTVASTSTATTIANTGTSTVVLTTTDNAGNTATRTYTVKIDKTVPVAGTMTMKLGSAAGANYTDNTWTNQSVYLAPINGSDLESGHSSTTYTVSGANTVTSTNTSSTIANNGTSTVTVTTTDNVGNISTRIYTVKIDKTVPIAGTMIMKLGSDAGANYADNTWTNQSVYLEPVNGSDADSGHSSTTYVVSGANTVASTSTPSTIANSGTSTVTVTTTDNTGNIATRTYTVKIDKILPTAGTMIMKLGSASRSKLYR